MILNGFQAQISRSLAASFSVSGRLSLQMLPCCERRKLHERAWGPLVNCPSWAQPSSHQRKKEVILQVDSPTPVVSTARGANHTHPFQSSHLKTQTSLSRQTRPSVSEFLTQEFVRIKWWLFLQDFWVVWRQHWKPRAATANWNVYGG